jgi:hypothetical protein
MGPKRSTRTLLEAPMAQSHDEALAPAVLSILGPDEELSIAVQASDAIVAVTDQRLLVKVDKRLALDVAYRGLRRIQFDIERRRPATLVIVPENPAQEAQVLSIPVDEIPRCAQALGIVSQRLAAAM